MPELSVVVPTFNERPNAGPLVELLDRALPGVDWEAVFVDDDSPDSTAEAVRGLAQRDRRVRVLQRVGRRGLSSAVIEGMLATSSPFIAVMDADLQHDERILPQMLKRLREEELDMVVGSRHVAGGGMGEFAAGRVALSNIGRALSRRICRADVSDPMSGFFMLRREYLHEVVHRLSGVGFKILLDLLASSQRPVRLAEVGYVFRQRKAGESKLDIVVGLEYLELLLDKLFGGRIPVGYLLFGLVGAAGVGFNFSVAALAVAAGVGFGPAQAAGALLTITFNYFLNNSLTFRARRLRGTALWRGLFGFHLACSVGLAAQLSVALSMKDLGMAAPLATLAGVVIGSVWNYSMAAILVWRVRRRAGTAGIS